MFVLLDQLAVVGSGTDLADLGTCPALSGAIEFFGGYRWGTEQAFGRKLAETSADLLRIVGEMNDWRPGPKDRLTKTQWVYTKAGFIPKEET